MLYGAGGQRFKFPASQISVQPMAHHRCEISSEGGAALPGRKDAEMGPANSLHALAHHGKSERFYKELKTQKKKVD